MTEIRSRILSRYLWYNESIQVDKASVHFFKSFLKKVSTMFRNFLVNLRENSTYMKVPIFNGYN